MASTKMKRLMKTHVPENNSAKNVPSLLSNKRKKTATPSGFAECCICNRHVPRYSLESHVNECLDSSAGVQESDGLDLENHQLRTQEATDRSRPSAVPLDSVRDEAVAIGEHPRLVDVHECCIGNKQVIVCTEAGSHASEAQSSGEDIGPLVLVQAKSPMKYGDKSAAIDREEKVPDMHESHQSLLRSSSDAVDPSIRVEEKESHLTSRRILTGPLYRSGVAASLPPLKSPLNFLAKEPMQQPRIAACFRRACGPRIDVAGETDAVSSGSDGTVSVPGSNGSVVAASVAGIKSPLATHAAVVVLREGVVLMRRRLSLEQQQSFVNEAQASASSFRRPRTAKGEYHIYQTCWGTPWDSTTSRYQPNEDAPPVPPALIHLSRELVSEANSASPVFRNGKAPCDFNPDACLCNFYPANDPDLGQVKLGGHQDLDETYDMPVVSVSIGDSMRFFYRPLPPLSRRRHLIRVCIEDEREAQRSALGDAAYNAEQEVVLASGDVLVFGGRSRLIFHGTRDLQPGTRPPGLVMTPGRLNFTFRHR